MFVPNINEERAGINRNRNRKRKRIVSFSIENML